MIVEMAGCDPVPHRSGHYSGGLVGSIIVEAAVGGGWVELHVDDGDAGEARSLAAVRLSASQAMTLAAALNSAILNSKGEV